jgi:spermidine/putrescine-binding protein
MTMKKMKLLSGIFLLSAAAYPAFAQDTVTIVAYSGLFQERYTKAVIEPFMAANPDIKIEYYPLQGSAQMLGTLRAQKASPQSDVTIMDVSVAKTGNNEGLFDTIDESVSKNVADLYPNARFEGVAGVGVTFDNLVLLYNTDAFKAAPTSWNALKDTTYKGKIAMLGAPDLVGVSTTIILDHIGGGKNYLENVDKGIEAMMEVAPNIQSWEPKPEVYPNVVNGQVSLGVRWQAEGRFAGRRHSPADQYDQPDQGPPFRGCSPQVCGLCVEPGGTRSLHRGHVLCPNKQQGQCCHRGDRPYSGQVHGQGHSARLDRPCQGPRPDHSGVASQGYSLEPLIIRDQAPT